MEKNTSLMKKCEICGAKCSCLCFQCINYFCESCFKFIHDKPANYEHKKENIDPFVPIDIKCQLHPEYPLKLFCIEEMGKIYFFIINFIYFRTMLSLLSL